MNSPDQVKSLLSTEIMAERFKKDRCRYCDTALSEPFLELGSMPLANSFRNKEDADKPEFVCPLSLCFCEMCHLVQLSHVVPPDFMFSHYLYVSATTRTFQNHFSEYAKVVKQKLRASRDMLAVDIGSNDGLLLSCYQAAGLRAVGVEPAQNLAALANAKGLKTVNRYFDLIAAQQILEDCGPASLISGNNVFAHVDDVQSFCLNVQKLLLGDGILVIEFPYLATMVKEMFFDMIYHEHLSYIGVSPLTYLMDGHGFKVFDIDYVPSHGGSLRVFIEKKTGPYPVTSAVADYLKRETDEGFLDRKVYRAFAHRVHEVRKAIVAYVREIRFSGKRIVGYGAPAKGNTLICFCGLTREHIDYIVDDNPLKQNLLTPGSRIPVESSTRLNQEPPDYVMIFAWNFAKEIMKKLEHLRTKGVRFIIPLPVPRIVEIMEDLKG